MTTLDEVKRYAMTAQNFDIARHVGTDPRQVTVTVVLASAFDAAVAQHAVEFNAISKTAAEFCAERDRLQSELSALKTSSGETFRLAVFHQDRANKAEAECDALKQALKAARPAIEVGANAIGWHRRRAVLAGHPNLDDGATAERSRQLRGLLSLSEP